jgi:hypothetical protein
VLQDRIGLRAARGVRGDIVGMEKIIDKKNKVLTIVVRDPFPEKYYEDLGIGGSDRERYDHFCDMIEHDCQVGYSWLREAQEFYKVKIDFYKE